MTGRPDDPERFMDESRYRTISVREFARRLRRGVAHDEKSYVLALGAGCSRSSGVPTAGECVRVWLNELKYLETGDESDVDVWAARRFYGYEADEPATIYAEVLNALYETDADRRREVEKMIRTAEPGFGYATLAQLMTHPKWGARINFAFTTNFDDLLADALHLYSQERPQIFTHESLGLATPVSPTAPTIVRIPGDAHLGAQTPRENRKQLPVGARERLRERMIDCALVFVGYGGRDATVLDLLEGLPSGAPAGGIFWVNETPPRGAFGDELERRGAIWVRHGDFDELMYYVRLEFGLGHPTIGRFERVFRKYDAQYRELSTRSGLNLGPTGGAAGAPAPKIGPREGGGGLGAIHARRATEETRRERLRQSLHAYSRAIADGLGATGRDIDATPQRPAPADGNFDALLSAAELELHGAGKDLDPPAGAEAAPGEAPDPGVIGAPRLKLVSRDADAGAGRADSFARAEVEDARSLDEDAAEDDARPDAPSDLADETIDQVLARLANEAELQIPPTDRDLADPSETAGDGRRPLSRAAREALDARDAERSADPQRAVKAAGRTIATRSRRAPLGFGAPAARDGLPLEPMRRLPADQAAAGDMTFAAALEQAPRDAALRVRRARYLAVAAGDLRRAEEEFEQAQQLAPDNIAVLRDYAAFALEHLRDGPRAERLLARALHLDLRNPETLRALARYLLRARGDLDEAENCLRLATELAPDEPRSFIEFAEFLATRRGRRDEAETALRQATAIRPPSARAFAELSLHFVTRTDNVEKAEKALAEAARLGPDEAEVALARALLAERKDQLDEAEAQFRRALDLDPRLWRARKAYVRFLVERSDDLDAAEAQLREAGSVAPNDGEPLSLYAQLLEDGRGDLVAAERLHRRAVEAEPYNPEVLTAFAEYLAKRDDMVEEADELFRDALDLGQRSTRILRAYGRFLAEVRGDVDAAEAKLREAAEVDPNEPETLDDLAQFLHTVRQDAEEAEIYFRAALRAAPNRSDTLHRFATFLRETRRDLDEAERFYRRALESKPKDAATLARAAQFLFGEGRRQEGLNMLTECFDAVWRMSPARRPASLILELWIYRYAHDPARGREALKAAVSQIDAGVRCDGWDMGPVVMSAIRLGHDDPKMLKALVAVACDGAPPSILDDAR